MFYTQTEEPVCLFFYFNSLAGLTSCAPLLLLRLQLLAFNCGSSTALPLPLPLGNEKNAQCAQLFKSLLLNVTELLKSVSKQ